MSIQSIGNIAQPDLTTGSSKPASTSATGQIPQTQAAPGSASQSAYPNSAQIASAVDKLNKAIPQDPPSIVFSTDASSNKPVVKVVDQQTHQVLIQIPSEEVIDISKSLDKLQGLLVKLKA